MAITMTEALRRGRNPQLAMLVREIVTTDELGALIPIEPVDGTSIKVPREGALPGTAWVDDTGVTSEESSADDDVPEVQFARIIGNVDVDKMAEGVGGVHAGSLTFQTAAKAKKTWLEIKDALINGGHVTSHTLSPGTTDPFAAITAIDYGPYLNSARRGPGSIKYTHATQSWQFRAPGDIAFGEAVAITSNGSATLRSHNRSFYITITVTVLSATANGETNIYFSSSNSKFDGLDEQIDPARIIDPTGNDGDTFSLGVLDKLISNQKVRANRHFMMNSAMVERFYAAYRALGGTDPRTVAIPGYGAEIPVYRGIPIIENDHIGFETVGSATKCSSAYLVSLSFEEGLFLAAQSSGGQTQALEPDADPRTRTVLGFRIEDIPVLEGKDAWRRRVKWYGAPVLRSTLACARYRGIDTEAA